MLFSFSLNSDFIFGSYKYAAQDFGLLELSFAVLHTKLAGFTYSFDKLNS